MKPKFLLFSAIFFIVSCKISEKTVVGFYRYKNSQFNTLTLNTDHTFLYTDFDGKVFWKNRNDFDSFIFITKGTWQLDNKELILNSYDNAFADTDTATKIIKTISTSQNSRFSFNNITGDIMEFHRVDDENGNIASIVDQSYSSFNIKLAKHKKLIFYFNLYKPYTFFVTDTIKSNYRITVAPIFRGSYFSHKRFSLKYHKVMVDSLSFNKSKLIIEETPNEDNGPYTEFRTAD